LNGLRSDAALALPRKSLRSVQSVLPGWASTERMPETCFSPQQLLCLHTGTGIMAGLFLASQSIIF
jgi:hypothetical protein